MTVSEKHIRAAHDVLDNVCDENSSYGENIAIIAAALASAEREGMMRAAEIARGSSGEFDFQSALAECRDFDYGFHNGKNHSADSILAAILSQANTHSPDTPPGQVNSAGSVPPPADPATLHASRNGEG